MSKLRRFYSRGQVYFITAVTYNRENILTDNFSLVCSACVHARKMHPFQLYAWVVLPNHVHAIIEPTRSNPSIIVHTFKQKFSALYRMKSRIFLGRLWQNRFWDHIIRNRTDMMRHLDYIHYNPVKHGLAADPYEYEYSSIQTYLEKGHYRHGHEIPDAEGDGWNFGE